MKFDEFKEKAKEFFGKAGVKTLVAVCAVVLLGGVVTLNFILSGGDDKKLALDLNSQTTGSDGENPAGLEADDVKDYFASISLQRKQARDEAKQVLLAVAENTSSLEDARRSALDDINKMAAQMEKEANIESLVSSKGFEQCVAVISDDKCSVIVKSAGLLAGECAQISEIVYEQAGILPENLKIIEKN